METPDTCPKCHQPRMVELVKFILYRDGGERAFYSCQICAHHWHEDRGSGADAGSSRGPAG